MEMAFVLDFHELYDVFDIARRWEMEHRLGSAPVSYGVDGWCIHEFPSIVFFFSLQRRLGHDKMSQDLSTG
jgi:hypothetical protein